MDLVLILDRPGGRLETLRALFESSNFQVIAADSLERGEALTENRTPRVIILGAGPHSADRIRKRFPDTAVILSTTEERQEDEEYRANLEEMVKESVQDLVLQSQRMLFIQEEERSRVSREIHDDLGQSLLALKLQLQSAFSSGTDQLKGILDYLNEIIQKSRTIAYNLSPVNLKNLGLTRAIKDMAANLSRISNIRMEVDCACLDEFFPGGWNIDIYRIVQELLTNIVKHSRAASARVSAEKKNNQLLIVVSDDGQGLAAGADTSGMGLSIVQKRVDILGARMSTMTHEGHGTQIFIEIPQHSPGR